MESDQLSTEMIRYECDACTMTATVVVTPSSSMAWLHHMESHDRLSTYRAWTWTVHQMNFTVDERPLAVVENLHV